MMRNERKLFPTWIRLEGNLWVWERRRVEFLFEKLQRKLSSFRRCEIIRRRIYLARRKEVRRPEGAHQQRTGKPFGMQSIQLASVRQKMSRLRLYDSRKWISCFASAFRKGLLIVCRVVICLSLNFFNWPRIRHTSPYPFAYVVGIHVKDNIS